MESKRVLLAGVVTTIFVGILSMGADLLLRELEPKIIVFTERGCEILRKTKLATQLQNTEESCFIEAALINHSGGHYKIDFNDESIVFPKDLVQANFLPNN